MPGDRPPRSGAQVDERMADALRRAAGRFGTPLYLTDLGDLDRAAAELEAAFPNPIVRHYAVAANPLRPIVARLAGLGLGASVRSAGEWSIARDAGLPNDRIVLSGVGKTDADLRVAVRAASEGRPLRWVTVESEDEGLALDSMARRAGLGSPPRPVRSGAADAGAADAGSAGRADLSVDALLRLPPDEDPAYERLLNLAGGDPAIRWRGLALAQGIPLGAVDRWREATRRALALLALLSGRIATLDTIDLGGGFPIAAPDSEAPSPARFGRELRAILEAIPAERRPAVMAVEPGRVLVSHSGWVVARVLSVGRSVRSETPALPTPVERALVEWPGRRRTRPRLRVLAEDERRSAAEALPVVLIDSGLPDLPGPATSGARHPIQALTSLGHPVRMRSRFEGPERSAMEVVGVTGQPIDALGTHVLPPLQRGDLIAIGHAGAYASAMASRFGGRPRLPEVLLEPGGELVLARRRGRPVSLR